MSYKYYDTPMGEDVFKKLWVSGRIAGAAGLLISTCDVMLYSYPKGYLQTMGRYIYITGPFIATAAAFTTTANMLASARGKDDRLNYFLGGVAAGTIIGTWRKSLMVGFAFSVAFGVMGIVRKDALDNNWLFNPPVVRSYSGPNAHNYDFTLTKERPRNWTTGPVE